MMEKMLNKRFILNEDGPQWNTERIHKMIFSLTKKSMCSGFPRFSWHRHFFVVFLNDQD